MSAQNKTRCIKFMMHSVTVRPIHEENSKYRIPQKAGDTEKQITTAQSAFCSTIELSGLPNTRAASANQNAANDNPREKPEEWQPCLTHKAKHSNRVKNLVDSERTFLNDGR